MQWAAPSYQQQAVDAYVASAEGGKLAQDAPHLLWVTLAQSFDGVAVFRDQAVQRVVKAYLRE